MGRVRHFIDGHKRIAWALIALALAMKLLVPMGFMPEVAGGGMRLIVCDGMAHDGFAMAAMPGMTGRHHHHRDSSKPDAPCPYAGLTAPSLGGAHPIQVAALIVAIIAAALFVATPALARPLTRLRPPLRGPPALA